MHNLIVEYLPAIFTEASTCWNVSTNRSGLIIIVAAIHRSAALCATSAIIMAEGYVGTSVALIRGDVAVYCNGY